MRRRNDDAEIAAMLLAVAGFVWLMTGDERAAAFAGIPGMAYTLFAVWKADRARGGGDR